MSYTYLQELGEESSAAIYSDIPVSVLSNGAHTLGASCLPDNVTGCYRASQSGMMSRRLTAGRGKGASMSYAAGSRVRTYPQRAKVQESTANGLGCGDTWPASLARFDHATSSWKTAQSSLLGGLESYSETWPRWGMMRNGVCWELPTPGRHTDASESGSWPTPTASEGTKIPAGANYGQIGLNNHPRIRGLPDRPKMGKDRAGLDGGAVTQPTYPTPTASMMPCEGTVRAARALLLHGMTLEETTAIAGRDPRKAQGKIPAMNYPTPVASEGADCGSRWPALARLDKGGRIQRRMATMQLPETLTTEKAALNPAWVEWLMGWPIGWTDLQPLETDRFPRWLRSHGAR